MSQGKPTYHNNKGKKLNTECNIFHEIYFLKRFFWYPIFMLSEQWERALKMEFLVTLKDWYIVSKFKQLYTVIHS
jgi:hypothetical protein